MDIEELLRKFDDGTRILCSNVSERQTVLQYLGECNENYDFPPIVDEIRIYGRSRTTNCSDYMYVGESGKRNGKISVTLYSRINSRDYIPYSVFEEALNGNPELCGLDDAEFNDGITSLLYGK